MVVDRSKGEKSYAERYVEAAKANDKLRRELGEAWCDCDFCQCYGQGAHNLYSNRDNI